jgi:hypothetical protein
MSTQITPRLCLFGSSVRPYRSAVAWFNAGKELFFLVHARLDLVSAAIDLEDIGLAEANLAGLLERALEIRYFNLIPAINGFLGLVSFQKREFEDALRALQQSAIGWSHLAGNLAGKFHEGDQWNSIGRTYLEMGCLTDARSALAKAGRLWLADELPVAASVAVFGLAAANLQENQVERAGRLFNVASGEIRNAGRA